MDQRLLFIVDYLSGRYSKKALCIHYGISRLTGDKWIERYRIHGPEGFYERSRRPHRHLHTTAPEIADGRLNRVAPQPRSGGLVASFRDARPLALNSSLSPPVRCRCRRRP